MTAWVGLKLAEVKAGDVVFISGAAGAVGSIAGPDRQAARLHRDRQRRLGGKGRAPARELGFDAAFNYRD